MSILARGLAAAALFAAQGSGIAGADTARHVAVEVTFGTPLQSRLDGTYGSAEADVLRAAAVREVTAALERRAGTRVRTIDLSIAVVIAAAEPSHPTRRQLADNPSLDALRSKSLGGAELTGTVRAADGRVVGTVSHRHFASNLETASPAGDAWADAEVAIRQFATLVARRTALIR